MPLFLRFYQDTSHLLYTVLKGTFVTPQFLGMLVPVVSGLTLNENLGWREYSNVGMILVILFFTVVIIESISYYLRTKLA